MENFIFCAVIACLDKSRTCVGYVFEIMNFATNVLEYFPTSTFTNTTFRLPKHAK